MNTTAGLIGVTPVDLGNEHTYYGPYNNGLYNLLTNYVELLSIDKAITGCTRGAETIWSWVALELGINLVCYTPCTHYGNNWEQFDIEKLDVIKNSSKQVIVLGAGSSTLGKENHRDKMIIERSDIMFFVCEPPFTSRYESCLAYAETLNKEIILIKPSELYETKPVQKNRKASTSIKGSL